MPTLFEPLTIRSITLKNRIAVSPNWPIHAAKQLKQQNDVPLQYERGFL
jgi:2,4-dienoyl-CoA reductase-like NADH-dependent reductase (Old Yellow Enzyme family)